MRPCVLQIGCFRSISRTRTREDLSVFAPGSVVTEWILPLYSSLVELSVAQAVRLPLKVFLLLQANFTHPSSTMPMLHAWMLLGRDIVDRDSLHALRLPSSDDMAFNKSCLQQKVGYLLYLVYRETDRSCHCLYRESVGIIFVFIRRPKFSNFHGSRV